MMMRSEQMGPTRMAGMALGMKPYDMARAEVILQN